MSLERFRSKTLADKHRAEAETEVKSVKKKKKVGKPKKGKKKAKKRK